MKAVSTLGFCLDEQLSTSGQRYQAKGDRILQCNGAKIIEVLKKNEKWSLRRFVVHARWSSLVISSLLLRVGDLDSTSHSTI